MTEVKPSKIIIIIIIINISVHRACKWTGACHGWAEEATHQAAHHTFVFWLFFFLFLLKKPEKLSNTTKDVLLTCPALSQAHRHYTGHKPIKIKTAIFSFNWVLRISFFREDQDPHKFGTLTRFAFQIHRKFCACVGNLLFFLAEWKKWEINNNVISGSFSPTTKKSQPCGQKLLNNLGITFKYLPFKVPVAFPGDLLHAKLNLPKSQEIQLRKGLFLPSFAFMYSQLNRFL